MTKPRHCADCGELLPVPHAPTLRYCNNACRQRAYHRRVRERVQTGETMTIPLGHPIVQLGQCHGLERYIPTSWRRTLDADGIRWALGPGFGWPLLIVPRPDQVAPVAVEGWLDLLARSGGVLVMPVSYDAAFGPDAPKKVKVPVGDLQDGSIAWHRVRVPTSPYDDTLIAVCRGWLPPLGAPSITFRGLWTLRATDLACGPADFTPHAAAWLVSCARTCRPAP